eukprot:13240717-Alexandrium_andersonii.AAC.1
MPFIRRERPLVKERTSLLRVAKFSLSSPTAAATCAGTWTRRAFGEEAHNSRMEHLRKETCASDPKREVSATLPTARPALAAPSAWLRHAALPQARPARCWLASAASPPRGRLA